MRKLAALLASLIICAPLSAQNTSGEGPSMLSVGSAAFLGGLGTAALLSHGEYSNFGIIAGSTSSSTALNDLKTAAVNQFHLGVVARIPLPLGLALQPALMYNVKGTLVDGNIQNAGLDATVGYLELPVQVQWGIKVGVLRPFVLAEPFVGYALNTKGEFRISEEKIPASELINHLEYGLGLGAGIEVGFIQINGRYFWNFGQLVATDGVDLDRINVSIKDAITQRNSFNGFSLSLAIFF